MQTFAERARDCNAHTGAACDHPPVRISSPGIRPRGRDSTLVFEGRPLPFRDGDTIAAALVDAGELACREGRAGDRRGVYCGMGVCHECVVTVAGAGVRACMTKAREGMHLSLHRAVTLPTAPAEAALDAVALEPDVLVVGAGPAGLAAAAAAAEAGVSVVVVDERAKLGGQYFKQPSDAFEVDESRLDRQYREGRALISRAERAGATLVGDAQIWAASAPGELLAVGAGRALNLRPRRLVLATGAYERGVPLPGWTLPGFMTTGAAQTLMRAYQVSPGRRVLVSGNGPLNVQVAAELVRAGVTVVALCESARAARAGRAPALAAMAAAAPDLALQGLGYLRTLRRARVPILFGHAVTRAEGDGRVERAAVARLDRDGRVVPGSERVFEVDAVTTGFGFLPSNEIARTLGVEHVFDAALGQLAAVVDARGRTSVPDVWVVGDGGGTRGARVGKARGLLAGVDAARSIGAGIPPALAQEARGADRARRRSERFQRALTRVYAAPRLVDQLADADTPVCRCEDVSLAEVEAAFGSGIGTIGAVKRVTRAGMGRCQGRYCAAVLAEIAARRSGEPLREGDWFAPSPPFKPLPVCVIAATVRPPLSSISGTATGRTGSGPAPAPRRGRAAPRSDP